MNEAGIDMDEVNQHSANFAGDHDLVKADDEDDIGGEQIELEINEDLNAGRIDDDDDLDLHSDDDDDDDDDDGNDENIVDNEITDENIKKPDPSALLNRPLKRLRDGENDDEQPTVRLRTTYDLTEEGIRRFITNKGGRVSIESIKEEFKQQIKAYSSIHGKNSGSKKFIDLVISLTINVDDPLLGTVLALRS